MNINAFFVSGGGLQRFFLALLLVLFPLALTAQDADTGAIAGRVVDTWQGSPLGGVTVLVRGTTLGTTTDAAGNYAVANVPPGTYAVVFTRSGYSKATMGNVRVVAGQRTPADYALKPEFYEMEAFEAVAEPVLDQGTNLLLDRQRATVSVEALGSDQISRLGAGDAAEAVSKVTGVTIKDGKFAVIRGLSDRYTAASLNGAEIPSADPERQVAQLDLFPAEMIERVEVRKTYTPDLPGGFTGGSVNIVTKSFPEKFTFSLSAGASYNSQSNLKDDFAGTQGGKLDWLGMDDGTRELPEAFVNTPINFLRFLHNPGINFPPPVGPGVGTGPIRLNQIYSGLGDFNFGPTRQSSSLNNNFAFSVGDKFKLWDRDAGFFGGVNYDRKFSMFEDGVVKRLDFPGVDLDYRQTKGVQEAIWGANYTMGIKPSENHELGFNFSQSQSGEDEATEMRGINNDAGGQAVEASVHYTERRLQNFQLFGRHEFPELNDLKFDWTASMTLAGQDEPDHRFYSAVDPGLGTGYQFRNSFSPANPTRLWREISENNSNYKLDWDLPIRSGDEWEGIFSFGFYSSDSERTYRENGMAFITTPDQTGGAQVDPTGSRLSDVVPLVRYNGTREIRAGYGMIEAPLTPKLKLNGGIRMERTMIQIAAKELQNSITFPATDINQMDMLPAAGLTYNPTEKIKISLNWSQTIARPTYRELSPVDIPEFSGGESIRGNPGLKLTSAENYDLRVEWFPQPGEIFSAGVFYKELLNPIEKKQFNLGNQFRFENSEQALVYGAELEGRKNLGAISSVLSNYTFSANFAYIISQVEEAPDILTTKGVYAQETRSMFDQSPYIVNANLSYSNVRLGLEWDLIFNVSGRRLDSVNALGPDIYEDSFASLDFAIAKKFGRDHRWKIKLSAKNLLNPLVSRSYDEETFDADPARVSTDNIYDSHRKGREFGISLSYKF